VNLVLPILVLAGAIASTYFFCVRPMRRGDCTMAHGRSPGKSRDDHDATSSSFDADLAEIRQELALLRQSTEVGGHELDGSLIAPLADRVQTDRTIRRQ